MISQAFIKNTVLTYKKKAKPASIFL